MDSTSIQKPIRILNIVPNMRSAGIETFIMNVYRNIDREKVQFDFIVHNQERKDYDDEIEQLGGRIYRLTYKDDKNIFKYIKDLNNFFSEHKEYKIIHGHMQSMMPLYLCLAKINKIPVRIAHSHNNSYEKTLKGRVLHIFSKLNKFFSTDNFACSQDAGKYMFKNDNFKVIYNGIEIEKFKFNENTRENMREDLKIQDSFVIGHIGRFELQKNHEFLINIFEEVLRKKPNAKLLLVGEGNTQEHIKKIVKDKKLKDKVIFLGVRKDVPELMQAFDVFVLPSLYEGLGIVTIEAQASGLHTIVSNKVAKETDITNLIEYLSLSDNSLWVNKILSIDNNDNKLKEYQKVLQSEFDIHKVAKGLEDLYIELWRK